MKKINRRAFSVLLIAAFVIIGMSVYVLRYIDHGQDWALYFSRANSGSTGELTDRNGLMLASFSATENLFAQEMIFQRLIFQCALGFSVGQGRRLSTRICGRDLSL